MPPALTGHSVGDCLLLNSLATSINTSSIPSLRRDVLVLDFLFKALGIGIQP